RRCVELNYRGGGIVSLKWLVLCVRAPRDSVTLLVGFERLRRPTRVTEPASHAGCQDVPPASIVCSEGGVRSTSNDIGPMSRAISARVWRPEVRHRVLLSVYSVPP